MTDLNDTERRIVKMLEAHYAQAVEYYPKCAALIRIALNAIHTGQHKDERYD